MTYINTQVNAIKRKADVPNGFRPPHGRRHTFASVAVSNGVSFSHMQKLLTHKDPSPTHRYAYLEVNDRNNSARLVRDMPGVDGESGKEGSASGRGCAVHACPQSPKACVGPSGPLSVPQCIPSTPLLKT